MDLSREGLMAIAAHEGIVLRPYKDSVGVWTIGVGHTKAAGHPDPAAFKGELTLSEALGLFRHDVSKYAADVARAVKVPLQQHEFDALVSFHYNTGAIGKASFVKKLNAGDRAGAIKGIMDWRKPAEIIPRRTAERDLFRDGKYPAPFASIFPVKANGTPNFAKPTRVDLRTAFAVPKVAPPARVEPAPSPKPVEPVQSIPEAPQPAGVGIVKKVVAAVVALALGGLSYIGGLPCQWFGWWC
jgi:lysozyme